MEVLGVLVALLVTYGVGRLLFSIARDVAQKPYEAMGVTLTFFGWIAAWGYAVYALFTGSYNIAVLAFIAGCVIFNVVPMIFDKLERGGTKALVDSVPRYDSLSAQTRAILRVAFGVAAVAWLALAIALRDFNVHPELSELEGAALVEAISGNPRDPHSSLHVCYQALNTVMEWIGSSLPTNPLLAVLSVFVRIVMGLALVALGIISKIWMLMFFPGVLGAHALYFYHHLLAWGVWLIGSVIAVLYLWGLMRLSFVEERKQVVASTMRTVAVTGLLAAGAFVAVKVAMDMNQQRALLVAMALSVPLAVAESLMKRGAAAASPARIAGPVIVVTIWLLMQAASTAISAYWS